MSGPYLPSDVERALLMHALGLNRAPYQWRNHFVASDGSGDDQLCWNLYMYGYMNKPFVPKFMDGSRLYQVSPKGIDFVTPKEEGIT
jgi:hypothetical protein